MSHPDAPAPPTVRLAHLSDLHIGAVPHGGRWRDWANKRLTGWVNLRVFGRGARFRLAAAIAATLTDELRRRSIDRVVFSGDATLLGLESEMAAAARSLGLGRPDALPGLAVPGNHDYYTAGTARRGLFEDYFHDWQEGERIDAERYPFAQRLGPLWLVGVNSCVPNRWPWDATGRVGSAQRQRLLRLLTGLGPGPRVLVTHYPVGLPGGRPERRWHRLRDVTAVVRTAAEAGVGLWLHGHRHDTFRLVPTPAVPFPIICAGSATQRGRWGYNEYTIRGWTVEAQRRVYDPMQEKFADDERFTLGMAAAV